MSNDFDYAHNNKNVIWMSQNTNHLPTHGAIQEAIKKAADEREYTKYPLASGLPELRNLILEDLNLPDQDLHITNGGTEVVIIEKTDKVRSVFDPSLIPEIMPINNEIGMVRIKTQNISIAVCPNLGHTTSFTGFLKCVEYPKSPVSAFPSHSEY